MLRYGNVDGLSDMDGCISISNDNGDVGESSRVEVLMNIMVIIC